jgi:two-component system, OmpR family, heavy metal sensor histidine kinase CusS
MRSLRVRLLCRTTGVLVLTFVVAAIALYLLMRASLFAQFDGALFMEAQALTSHVEQEGERLKFELADAALSAYSHAEHPHFFQIWTSDGRSAARSSSLAGHDLRFPQDASARPAYASLKLPNQKAGREVRFSFEPRFEDEDEHPTAVANRRFATIALARDTSELDGTLATLGWLLVIVTLVAMIGSIALTSGVIQHELEPLKRLARSLEGMRMADLSEPIQLAECPAELMPVVQRLNELLGRLDEAFIREKSFTADVAHELRTPLAGLQTALEVCASRQRDPDAYHDVIRKCLRITQGMHSMVNNLLSLARADASQLTAHLESVDIPLLLQECWSSFEERAKQRRLRIEWLFDNAGAVFIDREKTWLVATNLFDNAVTYADDGGWIRVSVSDVGQSIVVTIANSGCRLSQQDVDHVFDRFWRGDAARSEAGIRCGLGLSLCKKLVEVVKGTVVAEVTNGIFSVSLALPK